jgi:hypothetical protein
MLIAFRTHLFDASGDLPEGRYHGGDLAKWLAARLPQWRTSVCEEDWGWAVSGRKDKYRYLFGVYDHDTNDVTHDGPKWILRLYNKGDRSQWLRKLFKYIPPVAHPEVVNEIVALLKQAEGITQIETELL